MKAPAAMPRVRIRRPGHVFLNPSGDNCVRAGRGATVRATGFKRDIQSRPFRVVPLLLGIAERFDLSMRLARAPVPTASDDFAAFHKHRADHWIWRSSAVAAPRKGKCLAH